MAKPGENSTILNVTIPKTWKARLNEVARENGQSVATLTRIALRSFLYPKREPGP